MGKNEIEKTVKDLASPIAESLGLRLWDVRFDKEGRDHFLRIYVDKDGGVSLDDCVAMSEALDAPLDDADPIDVSYSLQVSSPGLERRLTRPEHYEWAKGRPVLVKIRGSADIEGGVYSFRFKGYDRDNVYFTAPDGEFAVDRPSVIWIKADDFDLKDE